MTNEPTGYIIYDGPSEIDGKRIVAVALTGKSRNNKTGGMLQTYIMRADIDPRQASKSGEDFSICGACPHRGLPTTDPNKKQAIERTCYVILGQGPLIVWKGLVAGRYPHRTQILPIVALGSGRKVRLGTYGDPAAVPSYVWKALLTDAEGHTGYSHQADTQADFQADLTMRSVDTFVEAVEAWTKGQRTFRVVADPNQIDLANEILCPASKEAGQRTTCEKCGLCAGSKIKAKSIAIAAHGNGRGHFGKHSMEDVEAAYLAL